MTIATASEPLSLVRTSTVWSELMPVMIPKRLWLYFPRGFIITISFTDKVAPVAPFRWPLILRGLCKKRFASTNNWFRICMKTSKCFCILTAEAENPCKTVISSPQPISDRQAEGYMNVPGDTMLFSGDGEKGISLIWRTIFLKTVLISCNDRMGRLLRLGTANEARTYLLKVWIRRST